MTARWIPALALLSAMLQGVGCASNPATASVEAGREQGPASRRGTFQARFLLTGELKAVRAENILVPRTPSWQLPIRWMEEDGVRVTAGQRVLELDNTQFTGDIEQKRLAESSASNDLARKRAEVDGELSQKLFAFEQRRIAREKARIDAEIPEHLRSSRDYQEDQLELARAESELAKAREDLETARRASAAEIEELRIALERTRDEIAVAEAAIDALVLRAPRDGLLIVSENRGEGRKFQVGDNVWVGLAVMRIPNLSEMQVVARLSDVDDGRIAPGMRARCALDIYPEQTFNGSVTEIAPIAQEESNNSLRRSFQVTIALEDTDAEKMRPGMSVRAEVLPPAREDVVLAPRRALDLAQDPPVALLENGSSVELRLGPCSAQECVVEEGLSDGVRLRVRG